MKAKATEKHVKWKNPHQRKFIQRGPKDAREAKFAQLIAQFHSYASAYRLAGYAPNSGVEARRKAEQLKDYVEKLREKQTELVVKKFVLDQKVVLDEMIAVAFLNPQDYFEQDEKQQWQLKPLMTLTAEQARAVTNVRRLRTGIAYDLPGIEAKDRAQHRLGLHLGLFHPKLIAEHRHLHAHAVMGMQNVDMETLRASRDLLRKAMGPSADLMLGFRPPPEDTDDQQDVSQAARERQTGTAGSAVDGQAQELRPAVRSAAPPKRA